MILMLAVVACYTICSLSDKYVVSREKINGDELSFFLALSTVFFLMFFMRKVDFKISFNAEACILLVLLVCCKIAEMKSSAVVLLELTAFELKAFLGICVFMSYLYDILTGSDSLSILKFMMIFITMYGLYLIVVKKNRSINFRKILLALIIYINSKFFYGILIKKVTNYVPSKMALMIIFALMMLVMFPRVNIINSFKKKKRGVTILCATRLVNTIGIIVENMVILISLVDYSMIQPLILVVLFLLQVIKREKTSKINIIGSALIITGVVGFQLLKII